MPLFSPDGNGTVMNRETEQISGPADAREKDELRRDLTVRRIKAVVAERRRPEGLPRPLIYT